MVNMDKKVKNTVKLLLSAVLLLPHEFAPELLGVQSGGQSQEMKV
jgi:hypothetical protein